MTEKMQQDISIGKENLNLQEQSSDSQEEVYFVNKHCRISPIPHLVHKQRKKCSDSKRLKSSFSTVRVLEMEEHFLDATKIREYDIRNYDDEFARMRWREIKEQFAANDKNREDAAAADSFGQLEELRKRLIKK